MEIKQEKIGRYIFTKNTKDKTFRIPDYQRPYVWDISRVEDFWLDLIDEQNVSLPFIGSFIFTEEKNVLDIVDGQQRIMTMYITLAVLRDITKVESGKDENILSNNIQQMIANIDNRGRVKGYTIECWDNTNSFFKEYILSGEKSIKDIKKYKISKKDNESQYNIKNNYICIYEFVKNFSENHTESEKLEDIVERILDKLTALEFVYIKVDSDEEAYAAFEITNARGQELGNMDLLKNLFFKYATAADDKEWAVSEWQKLIENTENLPKIDQEIFLRHYWLSIRGDKEFITNKKLFKSIKSLMSSQEEDNSENYKSLLTKLVNNSDIYNHLYDPSNYNWVDKYKYNKQIGKFLENIHLFNVIQPNILLLSVIRNKSKLSEKSIRNIIRIIEVFHFAYSAIGKGPTNRVEKLYGKFAEKINEESKDGLENIYNELRDSLNKILNKFIQKDSFVEKFQEVKYSKRDLVRYIFSILEENIYGTGEQKIDFTGANIEHIMAQKSVNSFDEEALHNIGNLIILGEKLNSESGNKEIKEKVGIYEEKSSLKIVKNLVDFIKKENFKWTENTVNKRAKLIAEEIFDEYIMREDNFGYKQEKN